jgi:hypothetical protein
MINIPIPLVFLKETKSKNTEIPENKKKNKKKSYNLRKFLKEKLSKKGNKYQVFVYYFNTSNIN